MSRPHRYPGGVPSGQAIGLDGSPPAPQAWGPHSRSPRRAGDTCTHHSERSGDSGSQSPPAWSYMFRGERGGWCACWLNTGLLRTSEPGAHALRLQGEGPSAPSSPRPLSLVLTCVAVPELPWSGWCCKCVATTVLLTCPLPLPPGYSSDCCFGGKFQGTEPQCMAPVPESHPDPNPCHRRPEHHSGWLLVTLQRNCLLFLLSTGLCASGALWGEGATPQPAGTSRPSRPPVGVAPGVRHLPLWVTPAVP